jgi:hypothetical protein
VNSDTTSDIGEHGNEFARYQRELALIDQVLGLQAALAQEAIRNSPDRQRVEHLEVENRLLRQSTSWRIGQMVLAPTRILRRIIRRISS